MGPPPGLKSRHVSLPLIFFSSPPRRFYTAHLKSLNDSLANLVPYPLAPTPPSPSFFAPSSHIFSHPTYGQLRPCIAKPTTPAQSSPYCEALLSLPVVQPLLNTSLNAIQDAPLTLISRAEGFFATFIRLTHFDGDIFNITSAFTNGGDEVKGGVSLYMPRWADGVAEWVDGKEAVRARLEGSGAVAEWVGGEEMVGEERGWSFRGGFWGKEAGAKSLEERGLKGRAAAEVWWAEE